MPPSPERLSAALDAALAILVGLGEDSVNPFRVAKSLGVQRNWVARLGLHSAKELQMALLQREIASLVADLAQSEDVADAARAMARNIHILLLAEHHSILWENGPIPDALQEALHPAPWWVAAAWTEICVEGYRRGVSGKDLCRILLEIEAKHRPA